MIVIVLLLSPSIISNILYDIITKELVACNTDQNITNKLEGQLNSCTKLQKQARGFKKALYQRNKSDKIDSKYLCFIA